MPQNFLPFLPLDICFIVIDLWPVSRAPIKLSYLEIVELLGYVDYYFSSNLGRFGHFFKKVCTPLFSFLYLLFTLCMCVLTSVSCFSETSIFPQSSFSVASGCTVSIDLSSSMLIFSSASLNLLLKHSSELFILLCFPTLYFPFNF